MNNINEVLSDYNYSTYFLPEAYFMNKYDNVSSLFRSDSIKPDFYNFFKVKYSMKLLSQHKYMDGKTNYVIDSHEVYESDDLKCILKIETVSDSTAVAPNTLDEPKVSCWSPSQQIFGKSVVRINLHYLNHLLVQDLIEDIMSFYHVVIPPFNQIKLVVSRKNQLDTVDFNIKIDDIDVGLNYGQAFVPIYDKIFERLNTNEAKGLVLFHGTPGTGKTSLIKYISKHLKKEVLFIPPVLGESLSSPEFIPFLINHANSILIIEDAERIIADRSGGGISTGVSNILNISDGILGDCLNIQIIATFNTKKDRIDSALLRKGRLIAEHEFCSLEPNDANRLLTHLGKNHRTHNPMTLTEIYNLEEKEYKHQTERPLVGFNR
jgi:hypothetical protein